MESKIEYSIVQAPNISFNRYELWRKDSFWGKETYYIKRYNRDGQEKSEDATIEKWTTVKNGIKLVNDIFDYKIGDSCLEYMKSSQFHEIVNCLYGVDINTVNYDRNATYKHFEYEKNGHYSFSYQNEELSGCSIDLEGLEISIIAKVLYQQIPRVISFKNVSTDIIRIFWGLALWRNAYIGNNFNHRFFVFNNPQIALDNTMQEWLKRYNLVINISDSDWI